MVRKLHREGSGITRIASTLGVGRSTVARDFKALELTSFSKMERADLEREVEVVLTESSRRRGEVLTQAALLEKGLRIQRKFVREALHVHAPIRHKRRTPKRRRFYESCGPHFIWCMDQNEKLVPYRIYLLAVVDAFSRAVVAGRATTALTGIEHCRVFCEAVGLSGVFPAHVCVDKAKAWNGVKAAFELLFSGGAGEREWVMIDGERIPVARFNVCKSTKNTPVERQWREANDHTLEWGELFWRLEEDGLLLAGKDPDLLDLWCLHRVFLRPIKVSMRRHWRMMNIRRKN